MDSAMTYTEADRAHLSKAEQHPGARTSCEGRPASPEDLRMAERLRAGDEPAFQDLVDRYHGSMIRVALAHVSDRSVAEEVVQDVWMAVLEGLDRFEGRSSLKTWIFSILSNKAKTRGVRESRSVPASSLVREDEEADEPAVDPSRWRQSGHWKDYWAEYPQPWDEGTPEKVLLDKEGAALLEQAIVALPPRLKQIIILRDVEGLEAEEVCAILAVSDANQRVLLHRARARVRTMLEGYMEKRVKRA
jgi:RNA polymerase sigma-70 factor (ECF subfamily)